MLLLNSSLSLDGDYLVLSRNIFAKGCSTTVPTTSLLSNEDSQLFGRTTYILLLALQSLGRMKGKPPESNKTSEVFPSGGVTLPELRRDKEPKHGA